ncbi:uncharacterized protein [Primulina huaijiensis]|uniref:uncharacterized protein n=1 Tax=Primulina huaijiensis TaxID=1492673 RepID=UPI003CC759E1
MEAFSRNNLIYFLKSRGLFSTISSVQPYCPKVVLEFYGNLSSGVGNASSAKFGQVFVRYTLYNFEPHVINTYSNTLEIVVGPQPDLDEVISVLTGGVLSKFPAHPHKVSVSNLTSLYSVLHKITIRNWTPTTNTTVVTKSQALTLFAIGNCTLNLGRLIFYTVIQYANGGLKSSKLPFPSLIYGILVSLGFVRDVSEGLSESSETIKIALAFFKGNRKIDLPWIDPTITAPASGPSQGSTSHTPTADCVKIPIAGVQAHLDHAIKKISQLKTD